MVARQLICTLFAMSFSVVAAAQTAPPKPKAAPPKKAPAVTKPASKTAEPLPAPAPPPPPPTDVQLRTKYVMGAQVSENSTYIKGARQRFEFPGITMIAQCDLKRSLQLHDPTKHYLIVSNEPPPAPAAEPSPDAEAAAQLAAAASMSGGRGAKPARPRGGAIAETITLTDTGERRTMFGFEARRVKTLVVRQPGENACETRATTVETDGWYADLPEFEGCASAPSQPAPAASPQACTDRVVTERAGTAALGFALSTVVTTTVADTKEKDRDKDVTTMSMDVIDLKVTSLDKALFDVPAGYTEVKDYASLLPSMSKGGTLSDAVFGSVTDGTSTVAPKKDGVIRVGVVTPGNKSGKDLPDMRLVGSVLAGFNKAPFEALPVSGESAADIHRDARSKACDFVLVSDVVEVKTSKPNKVGGLLKKVSGDANANADIHDVRIDFKLFAAGDEARPRMTSSVKTSSGGGFGVGSALRLATFAGQMYLTMGMGGGMMGGMMGQGSPLAGLGGGMTAGRMNPGMGAAMSIMSAGGSMALGGASAATGDASGEKMLETVLDGLSKAGRQVADELKRPKAASGK